MNCCCLNDRELDHTKRCIGQYDHDRCHKCNTNHPTSVMFLCFHYSIPPCYHSQLAGYNTITGLVYHSSACSTSIKRNTISYILLTIFRGERMKLSLSRKCIHFPIHPLKSKKYCILFLIFSYFSGIGAGFLKEQIFAFSNESTSARPSPVNQNSVTSIPRTISCALPDLTLSSEGNWGLSFQEEGKTPVGNASIQELASMDAYYAQDTSEKVLYLTFDAGYENGNTPAILDALKKHQVKATFFVVGTYIDSEPELIRQIIKEGHTVGNHTWHHPDMSHISSIEDFQKELEYVETAYKNVTGKNMTKYYRPPQGKYSEANLQMAKELGYKSFFWSLAYVDWYQDNQPSKEEAFSKLLGRIHPGAIVLLHSTSSTNAEILDELLTRWEEMGYHVQPLENIISTSSTTVQQHT